MGDGKSNPFTGNAGGSSAGRDTITNPDTAEAGGYDVVTQKGQPQAGAGRDTIKDPAEGPTEQKTGDFTCKASIPTGGKMPMPQMDAHIGGRNGATVTAPMHGESSKPFRLKGG